MVPSLSVPATVPNVVSTVPANSPVFGPVSVKVMSSLSPVTSFTTVTTIVSATNGSVFKSLSVTTTSKVSPGTDVSVMSTVPVTPPQAVRSVLSVTPEVVACWSELADASSGIPFASTCPSLSSAKLLLEVKFAIVKLPAPSIAS